MKGPGRLALLLMLVVAAPPLLQAQYFGRNKVQYSHPDWAIIQTGHFDVHSDDAAPARQLESASRLRAELAPAGDGLVRADAHDDCGEQALRIGAASQNGAHELAAEYRRRLTRGAAPVPGRRRWHRR